MDREELARIFPLGADSLRQPDVPRGRVEQRHFNTSRIFPGTERDYWIYVPAQYRAAKPACLLVVQDGHDHLFRDRWEMAVVLDNLIHQKAMPVTIGVFINPGKVPARRPGDSPRENRSFEYDSTDDRYVRFLLEEILPEVERSHRLRPDGNSRAIMGGSSGAHCALNAAWLRPDKFQRVVSMVGSYVPMRGGHALPGRVRLTAPKPLRIFLEGGAQDLDVASGDWWVANLGMLSALRYAGYDAAHAWDERAGHNEFHCSMVCPDALRWVWRDYPKKITARRDAKQPMAQVLAPQKDWAEISLRRSRAGALAVDAAGRVCFADEQDGTIRRLNANGRTTVLARGLDGVAAMTFAADGRLLATRPGHQQVVSIRGPRAGVVLIGGIAATGIAIDRSDHIYLAEPRRNRVMLLAPGGELRIASRAVGAVHGVGLSPDGSQLLLAATAQDQVSLASILPDGGLANVEPYFQLPVDEGSAAREVTAMHAARPGWMIIATRAGLQLNNRNGILSGFMPAPGAGAVTGVGLAGARRDQLYVSCAGRLFRRRIRLVEELWR